MDYVKPDSVVESMVSAGAMKAKLSIKDLLIRGILGGALLGFATTLAYTAQIQSKLGFVGALLFPVGFVMIILLGMELVTGNFALIPLAVKEKKATISGMLNNWGWVIIGHLIGAILYGALFVIATTSFGHVHDTPMAQLIVKLSEAKTLGYSKLGFDGMLTVFAKAILCNWMVCLGAVMAMTSQSTIGKIAGMWLPILTFFAQGFEHTVVNMFVVPTGMMLGANVQLSDYILWNFIPVTLGNLVGGLIFTGMFIYMTHAKKASSTTKSETKKLSELVPESSFNI